VEGGAPGSGEIRARFRGAPHGASDLAEARLGKGGRGTYTAATIVAMDRVNSRVHFTSDVVAGAFVGTAIGRFLVKRHNDEKREFSRRQTSKSFRSAAASPRVCDFEIPRGGPRAGAFSGATKPLE
jgi:hypothetical protein